MRTGYSYGATRRNSSRQKNWPPLPALEWSDATRVNLGKAGMLNDVTLDSGAAVDGEGKASSIGDENRRFRWERAEDSFDGHQFFR